MQVHEYNLAFTNNSIEVKKMNKKRIIAMVSTALLVTGCVEVGNAQTVAVENSGQSIQKNIVKIKYNHRLTR